MYTDKKKNLRNPQLKFFLTNEYQNCQQSNGILANMDNMVQIHYHCIIPNFSNVRHPDSVFFIHEQLKVIEN